MKQVIYRQNNLFIIDKDELLKKPKLDEAIIGCYAAMYQEFAGAIYNDKYKKLNALQRLEELNKFVFDWFKIRGFV